MRRLGLIALGLLVCTALLCIFGYREATALPIVRMLTVHIPRWPAGQRPVRLVLFADLHAEWPETEAARVGRIVRQIDALHPDIIVGAGDFVGGRAEGAHLPDAALAALAGLKAPLGVYAVFGNHDQVGGKARVGAALRRAGIRMLDDRAVTAGPLVLGGLDDSRGKSWQTVIDEEADLFTRMRSLPGARLVVAHRPDHFPRLPSDIPLMLAGHTHCGQIALPWIGPVLTGSDYGRRYGCGLIREHGALLVVTAGLGTTHVPLRFAAPPDIWLIELAGHGSGA